MHFKLVYWWCWDDLTQNKGCLCMCSSLLLDSPILIKLNNNVWCPFIFFYGALQYDGINKKFNWLWSKENNTFGITLGCHTYYANWYLFPQMIMMLLILLSTYCGGESSCKELMLLQRDSSWIAQVRLNPTYVHQCPFPLHYCSSIKDIHCIHCLVWFLEVSVKLKKHVLSLH